MKVWQPRARSAALVLCLSSLLAVIGDASAADLYVKPGLKDGPYVPPPPPLWQGFYLGGHGGGAWDTAVAWDQYEYAGDPISSNDVSGSGVIAGGQLGYNFQWGNIVFGPEADLGYLGLAGSRSVALPPSQECLANGPSNPCGLNAHYMVSGGLYGDITGRVGYAADRVLFYAKGGFAFVDADIKANYIGQNCSTVSSGCGPFNPSKFNFEHSDTLWGWTVGGGVEYALSSEWSLKVEYQHFDFGSTSFRHDGDYNFVGDLYSHLKGNAEVSPTVDAIKVGVSYHFNPGSSLR